MELKDTGVERWEGNPPEAATAAVETGITRPDVAWRQLSSAKRFKFLTADGQAATPLEQEALLGNNDLVEASFIDRCKLVMECVGRVRFQTPRGRGYATGFLIAPGLVMTNHHVFPSADAARDASIEFGYRYNIAGSLPVSTDEYPLDPVAFYLSDPTLDFAVVAVAGTSTNGANLSARGYLRLIPESGKAKEGDFVSIIQHPDGAAMQIALRENEVTRADETEPFIWYHADTAHGSSGAPVFNDSFQIVALHASGRIRRNAQGQYARTDGTWVQSLDGLAETDVIWEANVGYRISRICAALAAQAPARSPQYTDILAKAMRGGDVLSVAVDRIKSSVNEREAKLPAAGASSSTTAALNLAGAQSGRPMQTIDANGPVTVQITVDIGSGTISAARSSAVADTTAALETEKFEMRIPVIYDRLDERKGFDARFLELASGKDAPAPKQTAAGKALLSPRLDGAGTELKYNHFSVWIQKERRLALNTASNVDWRARKKVVDGKSTSRASLAGFPPKGSFAEQWVNDPRIAAGDQLPDTFYSDDRGAFDKGHIVRRDDVCWGETFEDIQMANGDTYHVTNCSPQIKAFNQGQAGEDNWGDLESHIQKATKTDHEKAIIYAGPVFSPDDRWFRGKDDSGGARIQIPSRFWKIVVVKGADGAAEAYGFVLTQDVRNITETEFYITEDWIGALKPISEIDGLLRGWLSLKDLVPVDHYQKALAALSS